MKKLYLMMSVLLACGLFCACSDEEDIVVESYDATMWSGQSRTCMPPSISTSEFIPSFELEVVVDASTGLACLLQDLEHPLYALPLLVCVFAFRCCPILADKERRSKVIN